MVCVFQIFIKYKCEFPFLVVLSQFQTFLSLTRYNQIFLLLKFLLKDFEFKVLKWSLFITSNMDRQLLRQKVRQKFSVMKIKTGVFVVLKTKHELKCQNELFLKYHFSGNTSVFVFITEII